MDKGLVHDDNRFRKINRFKNIHRGERCFIVATGPSVTLDDLERLRNEYTISMNSIVTIFDKTEYRPTYYVIQDSMTYNMFQEVRDSNINMDSIFVGITNVPFLSSAINLEKRDYNYFRLDTASVLCDRFYKQERFTPAFSFDADKVIIDGGTVAYSCVQLAAYMGFTDIYMIGQDCNYTGEKAHIGTEYATSSDFRTLQKSNTKNCLMINSELSNAYKVLLSKGIRLYNATRGGNLESIPRVDFESVINSEKKRL